MWVKSLDTSPDLSIGIGAYTPSPSLHLSGLSCHDPSVGLAVLPPEPIILYQNTHLMAKIKVKEHCKAYRIRIFYKK